MENEEDRLEIRRGRGWGGKGRGRRGYGRGRGGWKRGAGRPRVVPILDDYEAPEGRTRLEMTNAEIKALILVDHEDMTQEEAAQQMGVSRGTLWRYVKSARKKLIKAMLEGDEITIRVTEQ